jgi:hypothetical protein
MAMPSAPVPVEPRHSRPRRLPGPPGVVTADNGEAALEQRTGLVAEHRVWDRFTPAVARWLLPHDVVGGNSRASCDAHTQGDSGTDRPRIVHPRPG